MICEAEKSNGLDQFEKKPLLLKEEGRKHAQRSQTEKQHLPKVFGGGMKSNNSA